GPPRPTGSLVLQVPTWPLLEGDTVTLRCRRSKDSWVSSVRFCRGDEEVRNSFHETELSLSPLQLNHSGSYHCEGRVTSRVSRGWQESVPVPVTVHGELPTPHSSA
ncbi:FCGR2 protein, partial [Sylvia borin]|nr:FCGR2 protein [Sylvia borin]